MLAQADNPFIQGGALVIVGGILLILVKWLTTRFNGSIDALKEAVKESTETHRKTQDLLAQQTRAIRRNTDSLTQHTRISSEEQKEVVRTIQEGNVALLGAARDIAQHVSADVVEGVSKRMADAARQVTRPRRKIP